MTALFGLVVAVAACAFVTFAWMTKQYRDTYASHLSGSRPMGRDPVTERGSVNWGLIALVGLSVEFWIVFGLLLAYRVL